MTRVVATFHGLLWGLNISQPAVFEIPEHKIGGKIWEWSKGRIK
jgi:hypothetical protein